MSPTHLEGVWHNQYGSEMRIAVSPEGRLTGRYRTGVGLARPTGEFELCGFAHGDLIVFSVDFGKHGLTAWVGHHAPGGAAEAIHALWHMAVKVPHPERPEDQWKSIWSGSDVFQRGQAPAEAPARRAPPQPLWLI